MLRNALAVGVVIAVLSGGTAGAAQLHLIGSRGVKDNSLTSVDIRDGSLGAVDLSPEAVVALRQNAPTAVISPRADVPSTVAASGVVVGPQGPQGARGEPGAIGPSGPAGSIGSITVRRGSPPDVMCASGELATGGGYENLTPLPQASRPISSSAGVPIGWHVEASGGADYANAGTIYNMGVYAICAQQ